MLVALVVVGHSWTLLPEPAWIDLTYDWLYLWHIPAFVLVTGYLSRRFTYTPRNLRRLVTTVVVPYLVFEGLFAAFRVYVGGETLERLWLNPHWPMWYLAALFLWRLATPFFQRTQHPMAIAVAVSLVGGVWGIETLDLSRVMGLLPFFVAGVLVEDRHLEWLRTAVARRAAAWSCRRRPRPDPVRGVGHQHRVALLPHRVRRPPRDVAVRDGDPWPVAGRVLRDVGGGAGAGPA